MLMLAGTGDEKSLSSGEKKTVDTIKQQAEQASNWSKGISPNSVFICLKLNNIS